MSRLFPPSKRLVLVFTDTKPVLHRRSILGIDCWLVLFMRCLPIRCVGRGTSIGCCPAVQDMSSYRTSRFITHLPEPAVGPTLNYTNNYRVLVSFFIWAFDIHSDSLLSTQMLITVVTKAGDCTPSQTRTLFLCLLLFTEVVACGW